MKKFFIVKKILLMLILLMFILPKNVLYASIGSFITHGWRDWEVNSNTMMDTNITIGNTAATNANKTQTQVLVGIFQTIGSVLSVIALIIIGFRYMFSSLEEKAQLKGILPYYIIGCVLVFATSNILSIVYNVFNGL